MSNRCGGGTGRSGWSQPTWINSLYCRGNRTPRPAELVNERDHTYMPEPFSYEQRMNIDASIHPATVWHADCSGYGVRVQPRN